MKTVLERLTSKLIPIPTTGCMVYSGTLDGENGYGSINVGGKKMKAHRVLWEHKRGSIPDGMEVMHSCDVRSCCNIDHLELGSHAQNMGQMSSRKRAKSGAQKLSFDDVRSIRDSKQKLSELAEHFGVSESTISRARNAVHFAHV